MTVLGHLSTCAIHTTEICTCGAVSERTEQEVRQTREPTTDTVKFDAMIREMRRELALRKNVYKNRVEAGRMAQADADRQMLTMQAAHNMIVLFQIVAPKMVDAYLAAREPVGDSDLDDEQPCSVTFHAPLGLLRRLHTLRNAGAL